MKKEEKRCVILVVLGQEFGERRIISRSTLVMCDLDIVTCIEERKS